MSEVIAVEEVVVTEALEEEATPAKSSKAETIGFIIVVIVSVVVLTYALNGIIQYHITLNELNHGVGYITHTQNSTKTWSA